MDTGSITLGENVYVAYGVTFATAGHNLGPSGKRAGANVESAITVSPGSWIGANATILGGVTIAPGCVIGAGAIVTEDTEANGLYLGVPARRVKTLQ